VKRNKTFIKYTISGFIVLALLALLTACGENSRKKEPVEIKVWHTYVEQMQRAMDDLIAEFNETVGAREGIVVRVTGVANAAVLNEKLIAAAEKDAGAPELPDLAVAYPSVAKSLLSHGALADLTALFTKEELERYIPEFLEEGKFAGDALYLLPVAKSTEVLYVNKTFFDRFAAATGINLGFMETFEGIAFAAGVYRQWTDDQTPDIPGDGKTFFYSDRLFNYIMTGMAQMGEGFLSDGKMNLSSWAFSHAWNSWFVPAAEGSFALYNDYGDYLAKSGEVVAVIGSSAGAMFYPDSITWPDNTKENVEFIVLPYPVFSGGKKISIQRGGGMLITKSTPERERAAAIFLKWFTEPKQNLAFATASGYMPVTKEALKTFAESEILKQVGNDYVRKAIVTSLRMQQDYGFYSSPNFEGFEELQKKFTELMLKAAGEARRGTGPLDAEKALGEFLRQLPQEKRNDITQEGEL